MNLIHAGDNLSINTWSEITGLPVKTIKARMDVPGLRTIDILRPHRLSWWKVNEKNSNHPELSERQRSDCYQIEDFIVGRVFGYLNTNRFKHIPVLKKWEYTMLVAKATFILPEPDIYIFLGTHVPKDNTLYTDSVFEWCTYLGVHYSTILNRLHVNRMKAIDKIAHIQTLRPYLLDLDCL